MRKVRSLVRWVLVTLGVIMLTSLGIDAAVSPNGVSQSALGILAQKALPKAECPSGMVLLRVEDAPVCVDAYEASPSDSCPHHKTIMSALETNENVDSSQCIPQSKKDALPWTYVSYHQAKELCAKAGKRLLSNREWYEAVIGTPDSSEAPLCNIAGGSIKPSGSIAACSTKLGVFDGIGNVWEWIDASVVEGQYNNNTIPLSGYVTAADQSGIARETSDQPDKNFHHDYFWSESHGEFGMMRGGFFGSGGDAGAYSIHAKTPMAFSGNAVGFRCAKDM